MIVDLVNFDVGMTQTSEELVEEGTTHTKRVDASGCSIDFKISLCRLRQRQK